MSRGGNDSRDPRPPPRLGFWDIDVCVLWVRKYKGTLIRVILSGGHKAIGSVGFVA